MNTKLVAVILIGITYGHNISLAQSCHLINPVQGLMAFIDQSAVPVNNVQKTQAVLKTCTSCHGAGGNAKPIPFDNDSNLKAYIKLNPLFLQTMSRRMTSTSAFFKMPPNSKPLPDGISGQDVLNYVTALDH